MTSSDKEQSNVTITKFAMIETRYIKGYSTTTSRVVRVFKCYNVETYQID